MIKLLEAERQRADDAESHNRQQYRDLTAGQEVQKQLVAEIAALKGDQVPIGYGWFHKDTGKFSRHVSRTNAHNEYPFVASLAAEGYRPRPIYDKPQRAEALKGDQVPDGYIFQHPSGKLFWSIVSDSCANGKGVVPYYLTAPQKPVVLPKEIEPEEVKSILDPTANPDEYSECVGADMWNAAIKASRDAIEAAGGVVDAWIKCSDQLPAECDRDIWLFNGDVHTGYVLCNGKFLDWNEQYMELENVTHWMPARSPSHPNINIVK